MTVRSSDWSSHPMARSWPPRPAMVRYAYGMSPTAESRSRSQGPEKFTSVEFSPDGRTLAGADEDGSITLWDAATGAQRGLLRDEVRVLRALAFSPDSRILASAGETGPIRLWDVLTAQELHSLPDYSGHVHSLAFAPDGSSLAYCSHDGAVGICRTDLALFRMHRREGDSREYEPGRPSRRGPREK